MLKESSEKTQTDGASVSLVHEGYQYNLRSIF